jgi:nucleotide-binding universal stress UspA family protein
LSCKRIDDDRLLFDRRDSQRSNQMNRIIVPLDTSELSERALVLGQMLARTYGSELEIIHVLEEPDAFDLVPSRLIPDRAAAEKYLNDIAATIANDVPTVTKVLPGSPADALLRHVRGAGDVLVVMSTHGRGGLGRLMFGSVADKVLRGASVPVALVRGGTAPQDMALHNILVPLDGSRLSEEALTAAVDVAERSDAAITLVRVVEPIWAASYGAFAEGSMLAAANILDVEEQLRADARAYLDSIATRLRDNGLRVAWEVRGGRPADEIIRATETISADLIVISTHGHGGMRRFALGSVTNEVLHRGTTPVLAIPPMAQVTSNTSVTESPGTESMVGEYLATGW